MGYVSSIHAKARRPALGNVGLASSFWRENRRRTNHPPSALHRQSEVCCRNPESPVVPGTNRSGTRKGGRHAASLPHRWRLAVFVAVAREFCLAEAVGVTADECAHRGLSNHERGDGTATERDTTQRTGPERGFVGPWLPHWWPSPPCHSGS